MKLKELKCDEIKIETQDIFLLSLLKYYSALRRVFSPSVESFEMI